MCFGTSHLSRLVTLPRTLTTAHRHSNKDSVLSLLRPGQSKGMEIVVASYAAVSILTPTRFFPIVYALTRSGAHYHGAAGVSLGGRHL